MIIIDVLECLRTIDTVEPYKYEQMQIEEMVFNDIIKIHLLFGLSSAVGMLAFILL